MRLAHGTASATLQPIAGRPAICPGSAACGLYLRDTPFANVFADAAASDAREAFLTAPARRIICREHDMKDLVPVMCRGWAASVMTLSDGSRQILSFLLPGDFVSTALLFTPKTGSLVETITEVACHMFNREALKAATLKQPGLLEKLAAAWAEERSRAEQLIVDLGRRTADERIARLILNLAERLSRRDMTNTVGDTIEMEFPLRQHHVADATGLTPVHVSKVLTEFRRSGLISINDRSLAILDQAGFRRVANMG